MITFQRIELANGLKILVHQDNHTPLAAVNMLYRVGARNEQPHATGLAHLLEHLMFTGTKEIPYFDDPLERVGGENNAYTTNDYTNYYLTLPADNLETAFWLESDRMRSLDFTQKKLDKERQVVLEEFNESYLNRPYGDVSLIVRPMAYQVHPYQWPTIGKSPGHIQALTMQQVKDFFYTYYAPNNAIMVVAGQVTQAEVERLANKYFADIPRRPVPENSIPSDPLQVGPRRKTVERPVPMDYIEKVYKSTWRSADNYYAVDLLSDILANGRSSRLYNQLVKKEGLFSEVDAYIMDSLDQGLFTFSGTVSEGAPVSEAEQALQYEIDRLKTEPVDAIELEKVKNKARANQIYATGELLNRAIMLAFHELWENAEGLSKEAARYAAVTHEEVHQAAHDILIESQSSTLYYLSTRQHSA